MRPCKSGWAWPCKRMREPGDLNDTPEPVAAKPPAVLRLPIALHAKRIPPQVDVASVERIRQAAYLLS